MKKLFLALVMVATMGSAMAQNMTKQQERAQIRTERQEAYEQSLQQATLGRNITFTAQYMQPTFTAQVQVGPIDNFLTIYPSYIDCQLPYTAMYSGLPIPPELDFMSPTYKYTATRVGNMWHVIISVDNVTGPEALQEYPFSAYEMTLSFSATNGNATLTVTPQDTTPITYVGSVRAN